MKTSYFLLFLFSYIQSFAQFNDSFSDNNFHSTPKWSGDTALFFINADLQLQSSGKPQNEEIYLSTANNLTTNVEWQFLIKMPFNPSSSNFTKIYLTSSSPDLIKPLHGYFLKIGGSSGNSDAIDLYRQDGSVSVKLSGGIPGRAGKNNNTLRIKVTRDLSYNWKVSSDTLGGYDFSPELYYVDSTYKTGAYFGIVCVHSSTRNKDFYLDDFSIQNAPLSIIDIKASSAINIVIQFNKRISPELKAHNITINDSYIKDFSYVNDSILILTSEGPLRKGKNKLIMDGIQDFYLKETLNESIEFNYRPAIEPGSVLITEIYSDPTPSHGLPEEEYIELYNTSEDTINLANWRFSDPTVSAVLPSFEISPKSYLIICPSASINEFKSFGKVLGIAPWPSLNNSSDSLILKDPSGKIIHSVNYSSNWFTNRLNADGGIALELIDLSNPCGESDNWDGAIALIGGTPGAENSVNSIKPDLQAPQIKELRLLDTLNILIELDEKLDISAEIREENITILPKTEIENVVYKGNKNILISFTNAIKRSTLYKISISGVKDCNGNFIQQNQKSFALPEIPGIGELLINEILFNPHPGGVDFVELYNNSSHFIDLKNWRISNTESTSSTTYSISTSPLVLEPKQYLVLTSDPQTLINQYPKGEFKNFIKMSSMPALNDDSGNISLFNPSSDVFDSFSYTEKLHHQIIKDPEGISLERISFTNPASDVSNWHSAASNIGATPGYGNSQHFELETIENSFSVLPLKFSPNGDGKNDFALLTYQLDNPGEIATITVFDGQGRAVKKIASNQLLGNEGFFQWDGIADDDRKADIGIYMIMFEIFRLNGEKQKFKKAVILSY
ncbi:MAG: lamin tail domain-containing protein [Sporocytophaga sp.]|uniref:lamin tail domain-containing protein n=1 Tax=Sporocytophaga sp. TaxID=2231183 RepID=UPI001B2B533E|nr:lamin tail domain-containing protein [Sporocytophaga sp.]MBO9701595.1 lamin tail domain-containing protein [Sporocytophaga sp.]